MKKIAIALGTVLVFGAASAQQSPNMDFGAFDADASGSVTAEEFSSGFGTNLFGSFDLDASGSIDQNEFTAGLYNLFDANKDQALTQEEFDAGTMTFWGADYTGTAFSDLDADMSGDVTAEEFSNGFDVAGLYGEFDADANAEVNQNEFTQGIYSNLDANADAALTEEEFNGASMVFAETPGVAGGGEGMGEGAATDDAATDEATEEGASEEGETQEGEQEGGAEGN